MATKSGQKQTAIFLVFVPLQLRCRYPIGRLPKGVRGVYTLSWPPLVRGLRGVTRHSP